MAAGEAKPMYLELELEAAAILCNLKAILRARDRRRRRQLSGDAPPEIPSWGRRRLRSVLLLEDGKAERDGAASPDTPLASFPDSVSEEDDGAAKEARAQDEVSSPRDLAFFNYFIFR
jgi:hypothetical protein